MVGESQAKACRILSLDGGGAKGFSHRKFRDLKLSQDRCAQVGYLFRDQVNDAACAPHFATATKERWYLHP